MKNGMSIKKFIIIIILVMLISNKAFAASKTDKTLIIKVDSISFDEIESMDLEELSIGLVNLKTRKPYSDEGLYRTLNIGRKINSYDDLDEDLSLEYLGDVLREKNPKYLGDEDDSLRILLEDSKGEVTIEELDSTYDRSLIDDLKLAYEDSSIIALGIDLDEDPNRLDLLKDIIESNKDKRIYIFPESVSSEDGGILNKFLVPMILIDGDGGLLTSASTRRMGIIAIEDFSVDIKSEYGYTKDLNIGERLEKIEAIDPLEEVRNIYDQNMNLLVLAWICHGLIYLSQVLMVINLYSDRELIWIDGLFIFASNNILLTIILSFIFGRVNIYLYIFILLVSNLLLTNYFLKKRRALALSFIFSYILTVIVSFLDIEYIYKSYMGFNNIVYGARFYGFNNGMAAILLASSIYLISYLDKKIEGELVKKIAIITVPVLNTVILSARVSANTGSFITSLAMCIVIFYYYCMNENLEFKSLIFFIFITFLILGVNLYLDILKNENSHFLQFVYRIQENGLRELYYMGAFKLKELIKLTLIPPFSIVLIAQVLSIYKKRASLNKGMKSLIIIGLVGFIINDTGNILLIYMLNYIILGFLITDGINQEEEFKRGKLYC